MHALSSWAHTQRQKNSAWVSVPSSFWFYSVCLSTTARTMKNEDDKKMRWQKKKLFQSAQDVVVVFKTAFSSASFSYSLDRCCHRMSLENNQTLPVEDYHGPYRRESIHHWWMSLFRRISSNSLDFQRPSDDRAGCHLSSTAKYSLSSCPPSRWWHRQYRRHGLAHTANCWATDSSDSPRADRWLRQWIHPMDDTLCQLEAESLLRHCPCTRLWSIPINIPALVLCGSYRWFACLIEVRSCHRRRCHAYFCRRLFSRCRHPHKVSRWRRKCLFSARSHGVLCQFWYAALQRQHGTMVTHAHLQSSFDEQSDSIHSATWAPFRSQWTLVRIEPSPSLSSENNSWLRHPNHRSTVWFPWCGTLLQGGLILRFAERYSHPDIDFKRDRWSDLSDQRSSHRGHSSKSVDHCHWNIRGRTRQLPARLVATRLFLRQYGGGGLRQSSAEADELPVGSLASLADTVEYRHSMNSDSQRIFSEQYQHERFILFDVVYVFYCWCTYF